jgi:hypothetical protein
MSAHASFNDAIRRAAARGGYVPQAERDAPARVGDVGIGRGGGSAPAPPVTSSQQINERIRASVRLARQFTIANGVRLDDVDLDDLWR